MTRYSPEHRRFYNDQYYYKDKEYKPSKRNSYWTKRKDPLTYIKRRMSMAKRMEYMGICPSGWSRDQGWGALYKAWQAFIIRKEDNDRDGMERYAQVIRKIQKDIGIKIHEFADLKLVALEYMHDDENKDLLEEKAQELDKEVEDLNTEDVLNIMLEQDRFAYELADMQY
jgi:hypothetical protein